MHCSLRSNLRVISACAGLLLCVAIAGCGPSDPLAAIRQQQAIGDFAGSLEPLRALLDERRGDAEVLYLYGRALAQTGQVSLAEWSLRKAMDDPEWLVPAGTQLAYGALATRSFPMAIEATGRILEAHPDNVDVRLMRANAYTHSRLDHEKALADVDRIFELDPDNIDATEPRILALLGLDRIDEAAEAIEDLGRRIDESDLGPAIPAWHCATTALFADESGEAELAAERWADCLERHPAHPNVVFRGMEFYDARGESDRSLEILRRAQQEEPDSRQYRALLAQRLRLVGENEEAEALLREATESENAAVVAAAWIDLAKHQQAVGDYAAAARAVERAVELARQMGDPPPDLLFEQADARLLAGELDGALAIADEMTLAAHRELIRARVAQERGQPAEALEHFDAAFRVWPDNPWARYYAAFAAEAVGDFDRAVEAYRYAIRIAAGETDARTRLARLHLAEGRVAESLTMLRSQVQNAPLDLEAELLSIRLWAQGGRTEQVRAALELFRRRSPDNFGRALAGVAEGERARAGPEAAVGLLRQWESQGLVDFEDPRNADALRALVRFASAAEQGEEAEASVRAALRAHPDAPALHEILGLSRELRGAPRDRVREAYARAVELDAGNARALAGLGRVALEGDPAQALAYFDRAAAADPSDADPLRGAAQALIASGQPQAAEARLAALLGDHPYDAAAAAQLAELQLARGLATYRTLELANRAARFGGGDEALDLVSRVHGQRNEPERARQAAARARALRERQGSSPRGESTAAATGDSAKPPVSAKSGGASPQ
jgi:tetratricopeptide (TPR) repeat protein